MVEEREAGEPRAEWPEDAEDPPSPTRPRVPAAAAAGLGLVSVAALGFAVGPLMGRGASGPEAVFLVLVMAGAIWIGAFLVSIRHASGRWIAISAALFFLGAVIAGRWGVVAYDRGVIADLQAAETIARSGVGTVAPVAAEGPISAIVLRMKRRIDASVAARDAAMAPLGLERINDPAAIAADPRLLGDCGRFDRARALALAAGRDVAAARGTAMDELRTLSRTRIVAGQALASLKAQDASFAARLVTLQGLNDRLLRRSADLCAILAEHGWRYADGGLRFESPDAAARYYAVGGEIDAINDEMATFGAAGNPRR